MNLIVAHDLDRAIGVGGQLPWHLPDDLKHFKALTLGQAVLMGRKTFVSIGRPLPGRRNLVLSRDPDWSAPGVEVLRDLNALAIAEPLWVIGGGEIYALTLPRASRVERTLVHTRVANADAWFPPLAPGAFQLQQTVVHAADPRHAYPFEFQTLIRV